MLLYSVIDIYLFKIEIILILVSAKKRNKLFMTVFVEAIFGKFNISDLNEE